eukprot:6119399-Amphidinium_carterae.1
MLAAESGHVEVVKELLAAGAKSKTLIQMQSHWCGDTVGIHMGVPRSAHSTAISFQGTPLQRLFTKGSCSYRAHMILAIESTVDKARAATPSLSHTHTPALQ